MFSNGGYNKDEAFDIIETDDLRYIITGYTYSNNNDVSWYKGFDDVWTVKLMEEVIIPHQPFEDLLRIKLDNTGDKIYKHDLATITEMTDNSGDISNLKGIEYCINLEQIDFSHNLISDLILFSKFKYFKNIKS